jgi:hypothetical protein
MHRGIVFTWDPLLHTDLRRGSNELFLQFYRLKQTLTDGPTKSPKSRES